MKVRNKLVLMTVILAVPAIFAFGTAQAAPPPDIGGGIGRDSAPDQIAGSGSPSRAVGVCPMIEGSGSPSRAVGACPTAAESEAIPLPAAIGGSGSPSRAVGAAIDGSDHSGSNVTLVPEPSGPLLAIAGLLLLAAVFIQRKRKGHFERLSLFTGGLAVLLLATPLILPIGKAQAAFVPQIGGEGQILVQTIAGGAVVTNTAVFPAKGVNLAVQLVIDSSTATAGLTNSAKLTIDTTIDGSHFVLAAFTVGPITSATTNSANTISNFVVNGISQYRVHYIDCSGAVGTSNCVVKASAHSK